MKKHLTLIILILCAILLAFLGVYLINSGEVVPEAAGNGATLALSPSTASFNMGSTVNIDVIVNTDGITVDGVDVVNLNYPASSLELQKITAGSIFQVTPVRQSGGVIALVATVPGGTSGYNGTGTVATVTFKVLQLGTARLTFDFTPDSTKDCNVAEHGTGKDVLTSVVNGSYSLVAADQPTPTPAPTTSSSSSPSTGTTTSKTRSTTTKSTPSPTSSIASNTPSSQPTTTSSVEPSPTPEIKIGGFTTSKTVGYILYFLIPVLLLADLYLIWRKVHRGAQKI